MKPDLFDSAEQYLSECGHENDEGDKLIRELLDAAYRLTNERDVAAGK